jgi:hypothetical protein
MADEPKLEIPQLRPHTPGEAQLIGDIPLPSFHEIMFASEFGHSFGSYHCDTPRDVFAMHSRYDQGQANPTCIAAFWYVNGRIKAFTVK